MKTTHVNVQAIKLNFIQQVWSQNFVIKQDNFSNAWHKMKSIIFKSIMSYNLLIKSINQVIYFLISGFTFLTIF